jgi:DNA topoisomerase I
VSQSSPRPADERKQARAAGLSYVSDSDAGIRRTARGTGFSYHAPSGRLISNKCELQRVRSLAVPPAWTDVWICPSPGGHIQATGRDAKGRKQYRYHVAWSEVRDRDKFERILDFAALLPRIRARVHQDMSKRGTPRERVLATVINLLDRTLIRVGNSEYVRQNNSYGLTTLRARHVDINGAELRFEFKGKSGKTWRLQVKDRRIARIARAIQELPGQHLFKYMDVEGNVRSVGSSDVNDYLREIASPDVSAKDFRTWAGTVLAALALGSMEPFSSQTQAKMNLRRAIEAVATKLGNTPTICRKCYVHPEIIACYMEGSLPKVTAGNGIDVKGISLPPEEKAVLRLLRRRLNPGRKRHKQAAGLALAAA